MLNFRLEGNVAVIALDDGKANAVGHAYVEAVDMADIAAAAKPVVFGDYRRGYMIVDRVALSVLRDPYSQASTGNVRYIARRRVGGEVVLAEAMRALKMAAS